MKKFVFISLLALALPAVVFAFNPATLTNGVDRVAVKTEAMAQKYFGMGYVLETKLGAIPGTDVYNDMTFYGDVNVDGGQLRDNTGVVTQASTTNETLTANQLCNYNYLAYTPIQSMTLTLPATSTITSCLNLAGDTRSYIIENAATTTMNITIAAGAGIDLQEPDGQNVVIGQNNFAWLTFVKQTNGDMVVRVDETIPAD